MEKLLSLLRSKKFWTLVAAIVTALSAFFLSSCTGFLKVHRSGIHHDTVRYEQVIKSKNATIISQWYEQNSTEVKNSVSVPVKSTGMLTSAFKACFVCVNPIRSSLASTLSSSFTLTLPSSSSSLMQCDGMRFRIAPSRVLTCLMPVPLHMSTSKNPICSDACSVVMLSSVLPLAISRRGGRRGRPRPSRPSTKKIPLGGSHL